MKNIMKRAWEIYRTLTGDHIAKLSMALRMAWQEVKKMAKEINYESLCEKAGIKVWTGSNGNFKRFYINNASQYINGHNLSSAWKKEINNSKFYFDADTNEFGTKLTRALDKKGAAWIVELVIESIKNALAEGRFVEEEKKATVKETFVKRTTEKSNGGRICWECGRRFFGFGAEDGTCGMC